MHECSYYNTTYVAMLNVLINESLHVMNLAEALLSFLS